MGDDHPNALAYIRTVEAFRDRDFETIASLIAEDVVWHLPGAHPLAGDWEGRDQLVQLFAKLGPLGFTIREHDVFADDDHVCALSYIGARRDSLDVETREPAAHERIRWPRARAYSPSIQCPKERPACQRSRTRLSSAGS